MEEDRETRTDEDVEAHMKRLRGDEGDEGEDVEAHMKRLRDDEGDDDVEAHVKRL